MDMGKRQKRARTSFCDKENLGVRESATRRDSFQSKIHGEEKVERV